MIDRHGEPMVVALADWLPEHLLPQDRMIRLGADALLDALQVVNSIPFRGVVPVLFAMSSSTLPSDESRTTTAKAILSELSEKGLSVQGQIFAEGRLLGKDVPRP